MAFLVGERWMKFILEFLAIDALTTAACPSRITALDHEIGDDTMKYCSVVVAFSCELDEILRGLRDFVSKYFDGDVTMIGMEGDVGIFGHR